MGSPFEIASAYCKATDAAGDRPLDFFFEDAASAGVIVNKRLAATSTVRTEQGRAIPLSLIMTNSLLESR
jgi:hypothetical protein